MRTIMASLLFVGFVIADVDAQTSAGSLMMGGSGSAKRMRQLFGNSTPTAYSFNISPTVGYFPIKNLMVGLSGSLSHSWIHDPILKSKNNNFSIGPVIRYYVPFGGKFAVFPEVAGLFSRSVTRSNAEVQAVPIDFINWNAMYGYKAGAGVTWFVTANIGVELVFSYRRNTPKPTGDLTAFTGATVGIQFYLPGKD